MASTFSDDTADVVILVTASVSALVAINTLAYGFCVVSSNKHNRLGHRDQLRIYYNQSQYGSCLELTNALFSLFTCVMFIFNAYGAAEDLPYVAADVAATIFFITHYIINLYMAHNRLKFILSWQGIIDEATIIPAVLFYSFQGYHSHSHSDSSTSFDILRIYRMVKMFRVIRFARLIKFSQYVMNSYLDAFFSRVLQTSLKLVCYIVIVSGIVQVMDNRLDPSSGSDSMWQSNEVPLEFHDALYFVVVTLSTVGYGDVSPPTAIGRLFVTVVILFFIVWVPYEVERLLEILRLAPSKAQIFLASHADHIIIGSGPESHSQINTFLRNYCHKDNGYSGEHILIVVPWKDEPGVEWSAMRLEHGLDNVTLLSGDLQLGETLERTAHKNARAVFIFSHRNAKSSKKEDTVAMLRSLSCHQHAPSVPIYVQLIRQDSKLNLMRFGIPSYNLVCAEEVKNQLLSSALIWRGWTTIIRHLLIFAASQAESSLTENKVSTEKEYINGLEKELYVVNMTPWFIGQSFSATALHIFNTHSCILLGVNRGGKALLNPGWNFILAEHDQVIIIANDRMEAENALTRGGPFALGQAFKNFARQQSVNLSLPGTPRRYSRDPTLTAVHDAKFEEKDTQEEDLPHNSGKDRPRESSIWARVGRKNNGRRRGSIEPPKMNPQGRLLCSSRLDGHVVIISRTFYEVPALIKFIRKKTRITDIREEQMVIVCPNIADLDIDDEHIFDGQRRYSTSAECSLKDRKKREQPFRKSAKDMTNSPGKRGRLSFQRRISLTGPASAVMREEEMESLFQGSAITVVRGEATQANLYKAQVHAAAVVLIVGSRNDCVETNNSDKSSISIIDILTEVLSICKNNTRVVVELDDAISMEQVSILAKSVMTFNPDEDEHEVTENNSGIELMDKINEMKKTSSNKMKLKSSANLLDNFETMDMLSPLSSGDFILDNLCDILLSQVDHNENIVQIAKSLLSESSYIGRTSEVVQVSIPESYWTWITTPSTPSSTTGSNDPCFGSLFQHLLEDYDAIVVAVYRKFGKEDNAKENDEGFNLVAPSSDLTLRFDDKLHVIANSSMVDFQIDKSSKRSSFKSGFRNSANNQSGYKNREYGDKKFSTRNYKPAQRGFKKSISGGSQQSLSPTSIGSIHEIGSGASLLLNENDNNIDKRLSQLEDNVSKILTALEVMQQTRNP